MSTNEPAGLRMFYLNRLGFSIDYEEDGVYLRRREVSGDPLTVKDALAYVVQKNIRSLNPIPANAVINAKLDEAKIAPPQTENPCGEFFAVNFSKDMMKAFVTLFPAEPNGLKMTAAQLKTEIVKAGVTSGINEAALAAFFGNPEYGSPFLFAEGKAQIDGENGKLVFYFRKDVTQNPKILEDDRADYRDLDIFEPVKKGQLLVERVLAGAGENGFTVKGTVLKARRGKEAMMPRGKNTELSEDKLQMFAGFDGRVDFINQQVVVNNCFEVAGDVDMSVGNIDFDGNIVVRGNVVNSLCLKATGNIEIRGSIGASVLQAEGNIFLYQGIHGSNKGEIRAGGSVVAKFIEQSVVVAGEDIIADNIIHSTVECGRSLKMDHGRGILIGGTARAGYEIIAKIIGTSTDTATFLEVGLPPEQRKKIARLEADNARMQSELEKLDLLGLSLGQTPIPGEPAARTEMRSKILRGKLQLSQTVNQNNEELAHLYELVDSSADGKVHVLDTIYGGVNIVIGSALLYNQRLTQFTTYRNIKNEIVFGPCEYISDNKSPYAQNR